MSLSICVLGSGSSGNSAVVVFPSPLTGSCGSHVMLVDAGLSPRETAKRMGPLGLNLADISDILLTHLDTDHFHPGWVKAVHRHGIAVHVHRRHRHEAGRRGITMRRGSLFADSFELHDRIYIEPIMLAHDAEGSAGFIIQHDGVRLGYATDLGRVPDELHDRFVNLHALAIESNYDRSMQVHSARPVYLKQRIMGGFGHLSNEESLEAVLRIAECSAILHVILLHLSRQCNDPRVIKQLYTQQAAHLVNRLTITSQFRPTPMLQVHASSATTAPLAHRPGEQLALF